MSMDKYDTKNYNFECANCDDVFMDEVEAALHEKWHRDIFKKNGQDIPTGIWRVNKIFKPDK